MKPAPSDSPGFETAEAQPSVHTRPSLPLSSGTTVRIDDVPLHSQLDNLSQTRQSDVDWAALVRLVHQPQAYHEAKAVPEDTNTRPLMVGQAAKHAESEARAMASVDLYQDQPADSAYRKPTPRIKHARRPPGAAATLSREDRAFTPLAPTPKAPKGKRKASTTPSARSQKARKGNPRIQRQLGTDPDRPGLIKLKVKLPDDGSLHKFFAPSAILQSSAAPDAASGKDALPRPVASKTRPIDVTPVSTKGNAVQVPDANENRRSSFRARTNKIVTSHLIEGMGYLAKKQ